MDQGVTSEVASNVKFLGGKSWTAYVGTVLIAFLVLFIVVIPLFQLSWVAGLVALVVWLMFVIYRVMQLRSIQLYYDDVGIWLSSGVLPWQKGIVGVKWRDLDEAAYFQTLWSWLFNSFSIRIGHRFTRSSELFITHLGRGKDAVFAVNAQHQDLIRNKMLN